MLSVNAVSWSPDGLRIASASADERIQVWNVFTSNTLFTYRGHVSNVKAVAWSPDGLRIDSDSEDDTI